MGLWEKITGGAVEGVLSGAGDLAKDLRAAITGDLSQEDKARLEQKAMDLEQRAMEARSDLEGAKRDIIVAEAKGEAGVTDETHKVTEVRDEAGTVVERYQMAWGEDPTAQLFRLGFTVSEAEGLI